MNTRQSTNSSQKTGLWALLTGGLAALLASACCLGPLLLISLGISGAWIGHLTQLGPLQPVFLGAAVLALAMAWRRIWRPAQVCEPGQFCALPPVKRAYQWLFGLAVALIAVALVFPFIAHWFY
jgi:mercuric ion transport protein